MRHSFSPTQISDDSVRIGPDMVWVSELSVRLDRQLGYFGNARYCFFYFDSRADGLVWNDGQSYGYGIGTWRAFAEHVEPIAPRYGVALTASRSRGHVLLIDRHQQISYFAQWGTAERLVRSQHAASQSQDRALCAA